MKKDDFSFVKLRDEIINKAGLSHNMPGHAKELHKKLKFEPNLNITRHQVSEDERPKVEKEEKQEKTVVNITEISSRFNNKDSLNLVKKSIAKKEKKTIIINAESLLKPSIPEENKEKKDIKGEDVKSAINNLIAKDPTAYLPTTLPFIHPQEEANTLDLNENDFYLFQFPRIIPMNLEQQKKFKDEELDTEEPVYDQNGFLIKSEFENSFKNLPKNAHLGKMRFYKSGKIKLQIGDTKYDVSAGVTSKFYQELAVISQSSNEAFLMGKIRERKLIVTPDLNSNKKII